MYGILQCDTSTTWTATLKIFDCFLHPFSSDLRFLWPQFFFMGSMERHCIAYGCVNRCDNPKCAKLSRAATIRQRYSFFL